MLFGVEIKKMRQASWWNVKDGNHSVGRRRTGAIDTSVRGHKVISGGGVDSYALTLPVVLKWEKD